jgi:hypothetical protein
VAELVEIDVSDAGSIGHSFDIAMDGASNEGPIIVPLEQAS